MMKENLCTVNAGDVNRRLTRAQAAVLLASGQMAPNKAPKQLEQKLTIRANTKKAVLDENNSNATDNACLQRKRKAVLQDITNVFCENSYRNCFNATKIRAKSCKQVRKHGVEVSRIPSDGVNGAEKLQAGDKKEILPVTLKAEEPKLEVRCQTDLEAKASPFISRNECGMDDHQLGKQSFGMPSQSHCPSKKVEKDCFNGSLLTSSDPDIRDIDSDQKDPQLCSLYAPVIYSNLLVAELCRRPCSDFMETMQQDITQSMRGILVDWLVEVSEEYKLVPDTLYLTVYLIDLYLSQNYIERQRLQLLGITCMLIASKYEEICAPRVEEFCFITDSTYTKAEVLKMEFQVLNYFGFQIFAPTAKTFLRRFLRAAQALYTSPSSELEYLANFLAEMTLLDYNFLNFLPSVIAASAVFLARWTLDPSSHPWNPTLEHYSSYKASDLKTTVVALQDLQLNPSGCPLNAIRMKYRQTKFKSVAALSSPKLLETLF